VLLRLGAIIASVFAMVASVSHFAAARYYHSPWEALIPPDADDEEFEDPFAAARRSPQRRGPGALNLDFALPPCANRCQHGAKSVSLFASVPALFGRF